MIDGTPTGPETPPDDAEDARFEDAPYSDRPLRLRAADAEDLAILSSLVQDAVGRVADIRWAGRHRRLVLLLNRFRWEDRAAAESEGRAFERVRTILNVEGALKVRARGVAPGSREGVVSVLALVFEPGEEGGGRLVVACAGGVELEAEVEMLDVTLADLTRPWAARAGAPQHEE